VYARGGRGYFMSLTLTCTEGWPTRSPPGPSRQYMSDIGLYSTCINFLTSTYVISAHLSCKAGLFCRFLFIYYYYLFKLQMGFYPVAVYYNKTQHTTNTYHTNNKPHSNSHSTQNDTNSKGHTTHNGYTPHTMNTITRQQIQLKLQ
jgi:hypothetical protein